MCSGKRDLLVSNEAYLCQNRPTCMPQVGAGARKILKISGSYNRKVGGKYNRKISGKYNGKSELDVEAVDVSLAHL